MLRAMKIGLTAVFGVAAVTGAPAIAHANVSLSGITYTTIDSGTTPNGGGNASYSASSRWGEFLAPGGISGSPAYYNTTDTAPDLGVNLAAGIYQFSGYMIANSALGATNLFFDGSTVPGISVVSASNSSLLSTQPFSPDSDGTLSYDGTTFVSGSNSLSYDNGVSTAAISNYELYDDSALASVR